MAKIRYLADGTHQFVGVPDLPFRYLQWCPYCRSFSGAFFVKERYLRGRRVYRMACPQCGLYEVSVFSDQQRVIYGDGGKPSKVVTGKLPRLDLSGPAFDKPSEFKLPQPWVIPGTSIKVTHRE